MRKKLGPELVGPAARQILDEVASAVAADARAGAPESLKPLIYYRVSKAAVPRSAAVKVRRTGIGKLAIFIHGNARSDFVKRTKPHRAPPNRDLRAWARDHGPPLGGVLDSIAKEGTPFNKFLYRATVKNQGTIRAAVRRGEALLERMWNA